MKAEEIDRIIVHPELMDRDVRIILFSMRKQEEGEPLNQKFIAGALGVGYSTVERHLRRLRELGLLSIERVDSHTWYYDFSAIYRSHLNVVTLHSCDPSQLRGSEDEFYAKLEDEALKNESPTLHSEAENCGVTLHSCDPSLHIYNKTNNLITKSDLLSGLKGQVEMKITGPDTKLKKILQSIPEKSKQTKKKSPPSEPKGPKPVEEYNCNDMYRSYCRHWRMAKIPGNPPSATIRDRKHFKDMITEQGAVVVLKYIKWVFKNWGALCSRDKVTGAPNINLIYGYRRSWLFESMKCDTVTKPKNSMAAEYSSSPREEDDFSESWG